MTTIKTARKDQAGFSLWSVSHMFMCTKADASDLVQFFQRGSATVMRDVPARCTALRESARRAIAKLPA